MKGGICQAVMESSQGSEYGIDLQSGKRRRRALPRTSTERLAGSGC